MDRQYIINYLLRQRNTPQSAGYIAARLSCFTDKEVHAILLREPLVFKQEDNLWCLVDPGAVAHVTLAPREAFFDEFEQDTGPVPEMTNNKQ